MQEEEQKKKILNKKEIEICEALSEELKKKELILVGLDIIGNYLTEINVTSPTGVQEISKFNNFNISSKFWDSVENYIQSNSSFLIKLPRG